MVDMSHAKASWDVGFEAGARPGAWSEAALRVTNWDFPGFGPLTRVDTMSGPFPAQALRVGDRVRTRRGNFAEIRWVDRVVLDEEFLHKHPEAQPVLIPARSLGRGLPASDVVLSPGQKLSLDGLLMPRSSCVASDLVRANGARRKIETIFTYTMFLCAQPEEVKVEGLWVKLEPPRW
jgi:hypothetical protein